MRVIHPVQAVWCTAVFLQDSNTNPYLWDCKSPLCKFETWLQLFNTKEIALGKREHSLGTHVFLISVCEKSTVGFKENLTTEDLRWALSSALYKAICLQEKSTALFLFGLLKNLKGPGSNFVPSWQGLLTDKYQTPKVIPFRGSRQASRAQPSTPAPSSAPAAAQH